MFYFANRFRYTGRGIAGRSFKDIHDGVEMAAPALNPKPSKVQRVQSAPANVAFAVLMQQVRKH